MKILKPIIALEVELDNCEISTLKNTRKILFDLIEEMRSNHCTEVSCVDYGEDMIIAIDTLETVEYYLNYLINIKEIH